VDDSDLRFGGVQRLFSAPGLARLRLAHVCVIGIGGVGSWAVEALARSAIGQLTLIDLDDVCVSNVNRQLHALDGFVGRPKTIVMAERARAINPQCQINAVAEFFTPDTAAHLLAPQFTYVIDAIDNVAHKALLIARCRERQLPLITVGAAGGRRDAGAIRLTDLAAATHDALLAQVRKKLRDDHGFPREKKTLFQVPCIYSPETPHRPAACESSGAGLRLDCESGYGTASFVTGTFGLMAAGYVVNQIAA
jgi:tRNA A37 threonylcarbamoyladenosine dehydratase